MKYKDLHCYPRHKIMIQNIVEAFPVELFVFGSRITGKMTDRSDLDLAFYGPEPFLVIDELEEAFRQSDLPFKVDLIDLSRCSPDFLEMIQKDLTPLAPLL